MRARFVLLLGLWLDVAAGTASAQMPCAGEPAGSWCDRTLAGPDGLPETGDETPDCVLNAGVGDLTACDEDGLTHWSFDEGEHCLNCAYTFFLPVRCAGEVHVVFHELDAASVTIEALDPLNPVVAIAQNECAARNDAGNPFVYCNGCGNPLVSALIPKDDDSAGAPPGSCTSPIAGTMPEVPCFEMRQAGNTIEWGLPLVPSNPDQDGNGVIERDEMEQMPCIDCGPGSCSCGQSTAGHRVMEDQYVDLAFTHAGLQGRVYRIEILSGGADWQLRANCSGGFEEGLRLYSDCQAAFDALGAEPPQPRLEIASPLRVLDDSACPNEVLVEVSIRNDGGASAGSAPFEIQFEDGDGMVLPPPFVGDQTAHPSDPACTGSIGLGEVRACSWLVPLPGDDPVLGRLVLDPQDSLAECHEGPTDVGCSVSRESEVWLCGPPCAVSAQLDAFPSEACVGDLVSLQAWRTTASECGSGVEVRFESPAGVPLPGSAWSPDPSHDWLPDSGGLHDVFVRARCEIEPDCEDLSEPLPIFIGPDQALTLAGPPRVEGDGDCPLRVTWTAAVGGDGPISYDLYRDTASPVPLDPAHLVATGLTATEYIEAGEHVDVRYRVVARDVCQEAPNAGGDSAPASTAVLQQPGPPLVTVNGTCELEISWLAAEPPGVSVSYDLYRDTSSPVPLDAAHRIAEGLRALEYLDAGPLDDVRYRVVARSACQEAPNIRGDSLPASTPSHAILAPPSVAEEGPCQLRVTWPAAVPPGGDILYDVYRDVGSPVPLDAAHRVAEGLSVTEFVDQGHLVDVQYRIVVRDECQEVPNEGGDSPPASTEERLLPGRPTATPEGDCALRVLWPASSPDPGSVTYSLYRDTTSPVALDPANLVASGLSATDYLDLGWLDEVRYRVVASDECQDVANDGGDSDSATSADSVAPDFAGIFGGSHLGSCEVELTWNPGSDSCSGVGSYNVYRDHGVGHRGETLVATNAAGSPHVDVPPGNGTWVYVVRAVDRAGNEDPNDEFLRVSVNSCNKDFPEDASMDDENGVEPPTGDSAASPGATRPGGIREWGGRIVKGDSFDEVTINWNPSPSEFETPHVITYSVLQGSLQALREGRYDHLLQTVDSCGIPEWTWTLTGQDGGSLYYLIAPVGGENATFGYDSNGEERPESPICFER